MKTAGVVVALIAAIVFVVLHTRTCPELCTYSDRLFEPAHTNVWYSDHCVVEDNRGNCALSVPIRHEDFIPDKWWITWIEVDGSAHATQVGRDTFEHPPVNQLHQHWRWERCRRTVR